MRNHYQTLAVKADATTDEIKQAATVLTQKLYHEHAALTQPEKVARHDEIQTKADEIKNAYYILINEERRRDYDDYLTEVQGLQAQINRLTAPAKTKNCPYCAQQINLEATFCHHCQKYIFSTDPKTNATLYIVYGIVGFIILYYAFSAFMDWQAAKDMKKFDEQMRQIQEQTDREYKRLMDQLR